MSYEQVSTEPYKRSPSGIADGVGHAGGSLTAYPGYLLHQEMLEPEQAHLSGIALTAVRSRKNAIILANAKRGDMSMIRRKIVSTALAVCVAVAALMVATIGNASGQHQHGQQQGQQQASTQQHQHGGMMHSPEEMRKMMSQMAKDPEMLKNHLTMMLTNKELRPALLKLLRNDSELRETFEQLLTDAKQ